MEAYEWVSYFIMFSISFIYFYRFATLVPRREIINSIIMSNGLTTLLFLMIFTWLGPEFFNLTPAYLGPESFINIFLVAYYGVHYLHAPLKVVKLEVPKS